MTKLHKPVRRVVQLPRGPVMVTLSPDGLLVFREKGRRKLYAVTIAHAFVDAVGRAAEKAAKRAARKERKAARG